MPEKKKKKKKKRQKRMGFWGRTLREARRLSIGFEAKVPLSELKLWKDNPRLNEEAVQGVMESIRDHGFKGVLIATPDGVVRAGNTRLKALRKLKWQTAPVQWVNFPTEAHANAFALRDNKTAELAAWDQAGLQKFFNRQDELSREIMERFSGFQQQEIRWTPSFGKEMLFKKADDLEDDICAIRIDGIAAEHADKLLRRVNVLIRKLGMEYDARLYR